MSVLLYTKRLFSLDTLDTRLTRSSTTPSLISDSTKPTRIDPAKPVSGLDIQDSHGSGKRRAQGNGGQEAQPSKWATPEFLFYYVVIGVALCFMFKSVYDVSKPSHPNYSKYEHLLSPGWIPGRKVDNSDQQYSGFRDNLPYTFLLLVCHPLLRRLHNSVRPIVLQATSSSQKAPLSLHQGHADARLNQRVQYDVAFACLYLVALHGTSALKVLAILYINYHLATSLPKQYVPPATWIFNIGILFANEFGKGYPYAGIARLIYSWTASADPSVDGLTVNNWGTYLDSFGGLLPRWEILFNICVLRLVSFNMDYYWSLDTQAASIIEKKQLDSSNLSERDRVSLSANSEDYTFRNYFAYVLYAPLYLTGPILTFNDYISQGRHTPRSISRDRNVLYGIRFLISLLTMELMLHFLYAIAISKSQPAWEIYTPFQLSMLGYFNLHIIWLKLLLPWRFFRLWALLDGIDPPENMVRCMSDNYSTLAFWRAWHRSYNRWIVRYIYIPLGGSGGPGTHGKSGKARAVFNMLAVFTFVAMWHDIQLRLLIWSWLIVLFVLPEVLAGYLFPAKRWQDRKEAYRLICGVGAVGNILMMMAANLVGFAVGLDGLKGLVHGIVGSYSGPKQERLQVQQKLEETTTKFPEKYGTVGPTAAKAGLKERESRGPEAQLKDSNELDHFRTVIGSLKENDPRRKKCSRSALEQLLDSECDMKVILAFWEDPILNPWRAGNLSFFISHCGRYSKIHEMEEFCQWKAHQFYLGLCPDRNLLQILSDLSRLADDRKWQNVLKGFCVQIVEALKASPVLCTRDLDLATHSKLVQVLLDGNYCDSVGQSGIELTRISSIEQLENSTEFLSSTVQRWIFSWSPSSSKEPSLSTLESQIGVLFGLLPKYGLLEALRAVNRQLFDQTDSHDSVLRRQRQRTWWSILRSSVVSKHLKKNRLWSIIDCARLKSLQETQQPSPILEVKKALDQGNIDHAYGMFKKHLQIPLEHCPDLAEALILSPGIEWRKMLWWRKLRHNAISISLGGMKDGHTDIPSKCHRIELLERVASAYGQASHIPPHSAFGQAHECWNLQNEENLGPIRPAMIRALTLCGIVRPLQATHLVPRQRIEWILQQVAEVEGTSIASRLGADVWNWRQQVKAQLEERRQEALREDLAARHLKQRERSWEPNAWDQLTKLAPEKSTVSARSDDSMKTPSQTTPVYHVSPSTSIVDALPFPQFPLEESSLPSHDHVVESKSDSESGSGTPTTSVQHNDSFPTLSPVLDTAPAPPDEGTASYYNVPAETNAPAPSPSSQSMQYVIEYSLRDVAWNAYIKNLSDLLPNTPPISSSEDTRSRGPGLPYRHVMATDTREEAIERHIRTRKLETLMKRLEDARSVDYEEEATISLKSSEETQDLSSLSVAFQGQKLETASRGPRHGMGDSLGPTTIADALQLGSGGCLSVKKVLHSARKGEKRLDLKAE
ncbi:MAG: hypothetical protein Q9220_000481 [cf. Caloplaca sp. 1 TL-2023]